MENRPESSGLQGLDHILGGVLTGDNIVWQVDSVEHARPLIAPYCEYARRAGRKLIYFRFAKHEPLVDESMGAEIHRLRPEAGFETFLLEAHRVIGEAGRGAYYVFDCLSDLVADWYSDQMLANFFMLTCPYLYDMETVTYFPLLRNSHSSYATSPIIDTTQIFLDVYDLEDVHYIRPLKVIHRHSATMHMLHEWRDDEFIPVRESALAAKILTSVPRPELESGGERLDIWRGAFAAAERECEALERGEGSKKRVDELFERLLRMTISRDPRILDLARRYLTPEDILKTGRRVIGTGLIGGKSVGMLLARGILRNEMDRWMDIREVHDSFYVASDVFYTYLVRNGCWWVRENQRNPDTFLKGSSEARRQILRGTFPEFLVKQFSDMLDYFGQWPIIVRSSSLLEDGFGNAFAGKYDSVFLANQGPRVKRLEDLMSAVRTIYASAMSEDALNYRANRGLLEHDEQMALLVQRVSGAHHGNLFYPHLAGVGFSHNVYAWDPEIDPEAGVLRLVFGLGTRAVDRTDDDYTRLVALNAPMKHPEECREGVSRMAQRKVDALKLSANQLSSIEFPEVAAESVDLPIDQFATRDPNVERYARERGLKDVFTWALTLDPVLQQTPLVDDLREMMQAIEKAYECPVDIEFTANCSRDGSYHINLLQCRPLQIQGGGAVKDPPGDLRDEDLILRAHGAVIGQSREKRIDRFVYVPPHLYSRLNVQNRYAVARLVGRIVRGESDKKSIMLLGPGRWGTSMPTLGVPVSFAEINKAAVLCEIVAMGDSVTPEVSFGTHFLNELVEMEMLYLALFPEEAGNLVSDGFFEEAPSRLVDIAPDAVEEFGDIVRVVDIKDLPGKQAAILNANTVEQKVVCYLR